MSLGTTFVMVYVEGIDNEDEKIHAMKLGYLTEYKVGDNLYASYVVANDSSEANQLCLQRNLGEEIVSGQVKIEKFILDPADVERMTEPTPELMHSVCFLGYIALKSKATTIEDVLGDEGSLHELIHQISTTAGIEISALKFKIRALINLVPGVY